MYIAAQWYYAKAFVECSSQLYPLLQINYSINSIFELVKDVKVQYTSGVTLHSQAVYS